RLAPGLVALAVGGLAPPLGSAAHPVAVGGVPMAALAGVYFLGLLGEQRWRWAGALGGLGLLAGLDPPPVQGLDLSLLPLPGGEALAVAAAWAAPVHAIRYLRAEGRVATRMLFGAVLLLDVGFTCTRLSRPERPAPSTLVAALAVHARSAVLTVLPEGSAATVGLCPDHRQRVLGLPAGAEAAGDVPPPMGLHRGTLLVGGSSAEASVISTALGAPRGLAPGIAYWVAR
ncbi:MAG: hypothetical protein FJ090_04085, partial [Deltaproteobacteria bacterium]|nr:hypothetical protein [Deltaproteobacteria bacterium]